MLRRNFLRCSGVLGAGALASELLHSRTASAAEQGAAKNMTKRPIQIRMGGYGPSTTGFSLALKMIGDRLKAKFGGEVDVKYVYNIMDLGYKAEDILWLVEDGILSLGYQSSSYLTDRVPALGMVDLPFIFDSNEKARGAMDGELGRVLTRKIEEQMNYHIAGYFENGFRQVSNRLRPIHLPADMKGMTIRVLPSKIQARTFELLGATPLIMDLTEAIQRVKAGTLDAQENPFFNTVTYGVDKYHRFHSVTNHFYLSRPIFINRTQFDAWPNELKAEMTAAVHDAVAFQRELHIKEELDAAATIKKGGGEIIELTPKEHAAFVAAVQPLHREARDLYSKEMLALVGL